MTSIKVEIVRPNRVALSRWPEESEKQGLAKDIAAARSAPAVAVRTEDTEQIAMLEYGEGVVVELKPLSVDDPTLPEQQLATDIAAPTAKTDKPPQQRKATQVREDN